MYEVSVREFFYIGLSSFVFQFHLVGAPDGVQIRNAKISNNYE